MIPKEFLKFLETLGIASEDFLRILTAAGEKFGADAEVIDAVSTWFQENVKVKVDPAYLLSLATIAVQELRMNRAGYNPDAPRNI